MKYPCIDYHPYFKVERVQTYDKNGWNFIDQLHQFVDGGMSDVSFINTISEIVTEAVGSSVPFTGQRWANFNMLLTNLKLKDEQSLSDFFANSRFQWSGTTRTLTCSGLPLTLLISTMSSILFTRI